MVLSAMAEADYITRDAADARQRRSDHRGRPRRRQRGALLRRLPRATSCRPSLPGVTQRPGALDVYTTLDLNLQRYAQDAVRERARAGRSDARRGAKAKPAPAQAALVAVDPRTGEVLALVGGRFYNQSQFNRAIAARRQPGSTFKPFVYLAAFERAADEGRADLTPATMVWDEPTTWTFDEQEWSPRNYDNEYDGYITLRRALALSRNIATIKVAEQTGFDHVAALWKRTKVGKTALQGYPVDRARRVRAHAARGGDRLHALRQRRRDQAAARHRAHRERRGVDRAEDRRGPAHRARRRPRSS